jgi:hypothetical protein
VSPRAWRNGLLFAAILWALIILAAWGADRALSAPLRLQHSIDALVGRTVALNCTYAGSAEAESFPDGGPTSPLPTMFVRPGWCADARAFVVHPAADDAPALLILTHESLHLRVWAGYADERQVECEALREVGTFALMLGAFPALIPAIVARAAEFHAASWPFACAVPA